MTAMVKLPPEAEWPTARMVHYGTLTLLPTGEAVLGCPANTPPAVAAEARERVEQWRAAQLRGSGVTASVVLVLPFPVDVLVMDT